MDEADLLARVRNLDREALAEMYDTYSDDLYGYAFRLLNNRQLAEDCVGESFTRILETLRSGKGPQTSLKAYLYRIAHNWITDIYRRQPPEPYILDEKLPNSENGTEMKVDARVAQNHVRHALRALTPDQRQVIMLKFVEGWSNDQVSVALRKPIGAIKSLQHRALESLRRALKQADGEDHGSF
jgi:RNA polymerase sigma-70 factor, ECF subfamily